MPQSDQPHPPELAIRSIAGQHLRIRPTAREYPESADPADSDWILADIEVRLKHFHGQSTASLSASALSRFRDELRGLCQTMKGNARYAPIEPWILINLKSDCRTEVQAMCVVRDELSSGGAELRFQIDLDPAFLAPLLEQLDRICQAFPVTGR